MYDCMTLYYFVPMPRRNKRQLVVGGEVGAYVAMRSETMLGNPAPDDLQFFLLTQSSQCGDVTRREILKTTKPGLLSESCRLLTRCTPASASEVSEQSGLHRCHPRARPETRVTPGPPPFFFPSSFFKPQDIESKQ